MKKISSILKLKRFLCICLFMGVSICSSCSEVIKFRAHAFSFREKDEDTNEWKSWADWQVDNSLIVMNDDAINIYGKHEEQFDVIEEDQFVDEQGEHNYPFICIDSDGVRCRFVVRWTTVDQPIQLYCRYSNLQYVYEVEMVQ